MEFKKKLIKITEVSRAVILPKSLLNYYNIKDDDELIICDDEDKIIIRKSKDDKQQ